MGLWLSHLTVYLANSQWRAPKAGQNNNNNNDDDKNNNNNNQCQCAWRITDSPLAAAAAWRNMSKSKRKTRQSQPKHESHIFTFTSFNRFNHSIESIILIINRLVLITDKKHERRRRGRSDASRWRNQRR